MNDKLVIKINKKSLVENYERLLKHTGGNLAPVIKGNGYGHGLVEVASILEPLSPAFLCVDSYLEAKHLINNGINSDILIMGYVSDEKIQENPHTQIIFTVASLEQLLGLIERQVTARVHLKFDTGMYRLGIYTHQYSEVIKTLSVKNNLKIEGVMSHLADSDNPSSDITPAQIETWNSLVEKIDIPSVTHWHITATYGMKYANQLKNVTTFRTGLALFGYGDMPELKPVLSMFSTVALVKEIPKSARIGYGGSYTAEKDLKMAVVPVGYYEAIRRELFRKGSFYIDGQPCLIIGRNMNMTMVDATHLPKVVRDMEVEVISSSPGRENSVVSMAKLAGTNPYDILVNIADSLPRTIIES